MLEGSRLNPIKRYVQTISILIDDNDTVDALFDNSGEIIRRLTYYIDG